MACGVSVRASGAERVRGARTQADTLLLHQAQQQVHWWQHLEQVLAARRSSSGLGLRLPCVGGERVLRARARASQTRLLIGRTCPGRPPHAPKRRCMCAFVCEGVCCRRLFFLLGSKCVCAFLSIVE